MYAIKKSAMQQPSSIVFLYLLGLSFTVLFVDRPGQSTLIDEFILLLFLPIAVFGLYKYFFLLGPAAKLLLLYFSVAMLSSVVILTIRSDIPWAAPVLGLILDVKLFVFLGALLYVSARSKSSPENMVMSICHVIVFFGLFHSLFFLRDVFSSGMALSGIRLRSSGIYGYVPIGLFSHKLYTAALSALSFASSITIYLFRKEMKYLFFSFVFFVILILASSMKELSVLVVVALLMLRALSNKKDSISGASKKLTVVTVLLLPVVAFVFGSALDKLVGSRVDVYLFEENARAALHIKSAEIASDYFPLGSGAGTFSSQPSRSLYYSPLYYEYGINFYYGGSEEFSAFLMDVGWPKFIAEAGWIGGGAYFLSYLVVMLRLMVSLFKRPTPVSVFGVFLGAIVFSSALGSAIFTGDLGLMICALFFFCGYLYLKGKRVSNVLLY